MIQNVRINSVCILYNYCDIIVFKFPNIETYPGQHVELYIGDDENDEVSLLCCRLLIDRTICNSSMHVVP